MNSFAKERVRLVRRLSDRIGETVSGVQEIRGNDTSAYERAAMSAALGEIYTVRLRIFLWKFVIKFLNNSINHLGPFCFYSIGGYFVIDGQLEIGTLIAAITAHKDLAAPWKELLNYYQRREDARIKYEQVVNQFNPPGMLDETLQLGSPPAGARVRGELAASGLALRDDTGTSFLDGVSLRVPADTTVAVVGAPGSGREELALVLVRLMNPTSGALTIGGERSDRLHEGVTGRRLRLVRRPAAVPVQRDGSRQPPLRTQARAESRQGAGSALGGGSGGRRKLDRRRERGLDRPRGPGRRCPAEAARGAGGGRARR